MKCTTAKKWISEYIDGVLDKRKEASLEDHCADCLDCQKIIADFRNISRSAKDLREMIPPDSTWLKIHKRMTTGEQKIVTVVPRRRSRLSRPRLSYAVGAALILVVVIGLFVTGIFNGNGRGILPGSELQQYTLGKLQEAEHHYKLAIKALAEAVSAQEGALNPAMTEVFRTNLAIVDASIDASQKVVLNDPDNIESRNYLLTAYREKTNLLTQIMAVTEKSSDKKEVEETL